MSTLKKYTLILNYFLLFYGANAQSKPMSVTDHIRFWGNITGGTTKDTFQVIYWKEYINHLVGAQIINIPLDKMGNFSCELPIPQHITRVVLQKRGTAFANLGNYPVEKGDDIRILITPKEDDNDIQFAGQGSEKYSLRQHYLSIKDQFASDRQQLGDIRTQTNDLAKLEAMAMKAKTSIHALLNSHRQQLSHAAFTYLSAEYVAYFDMIVQLETNNAFNGCNNDTCKKMVNNLASRYKPGASIEVDSIAAYSMEYLLSVLFVEKTNMLLNKAPEEFTFNNFVQHIMTRYRHLMREKLLMMAFLDQSIKSSFDETRPGEYDSTLQFAYTTVKTPYIKSELYKIMNAVSKGAIAYPFRLMDKNSKYVSLDSLKGNVVLMHMWFTGCTGCVQFNQKLKNAILPKLEAHKNFKIVSIGTDEQRALWLKSIDSHLYTGDADINLYAGEMSFAQMPIVDHYQIQSMPFILLIDQEGKIICQLSNLQSDKELLSVIEGALNKQVKN